MNAVNRRYLPARNFVLGATATSAAVCLTGTVGWWAFLPLLVLQLELTARLYDLGILGKIPKKPSSKSLFQSADGVFTWQELAAHNSEESAWVAVDGAVYDITEFIDRHPGGKEVILLAAGREATDLVNSYHPFSDVPRKILKKYRIGSLATFEHPIYKPDSGFYKEAAAEVKKYFDENNIESKNPWTGLVRMTPVYICFFSSFYAVYCADGVPLMFRIGLAIFMGMCQGMPLTGWMHDASHTSIGRSERWWWYVGRLSLDYVSGSSLLSWRHQHVIGHHVYTNVMGADPDLPTSLTADPRRLVPEQAWKKLYRWQHLYLPPLYGILGLKSRMQDFTEVYSRLENGPIRVNPIATQDYLRLISSKAMWAFYRLVVPFAFFSALSSREMAMLFFCTEFTTGYWLAFNFQVSHVSSEADFLFSDTKKRDDGKCPAVIDDEWAHTQVKTTIDYSHGNPLAAYFSGALNYQTIHHLFPTVSQYHYPALTPIVMKVAEKHDLKFVVFDSFLDAFSAHISHLRNLGLEGKAAELKLE